MFTVNESILEVRLCVDMSFLAWSYGCNPFLYGEIFQVPRKFEKVCLSCSSNVLSKLSNGFITSRFMGQGGTNEGEKMFNTCNMSA